MTDIKSQWVFSLGFSCNKQKFMIQMNSLYVDKSTISKEFEQFAIELHSIVCN